MRIPCSLLIFLSHLLVLHLSAGPCATALDGVQNLKFSHLLGGKHASFIASPYRIPTFPQRKRDYRRLGCNSTRGVDTHSQHAPVSESSWKKLIPASNTIKLRDLVLSSASKVTAEANRLLTRVRASRGYRLLVENLGRVRRHMSQLTIAEQFCLLVTGKLIYSFVLPMYHVSFPFQLFPTDSGLGVDIGLDTLVSIPFLFHFLRQCRFPHTYFKIPERSPLKLLLVVSSLVGSFYLSSFFTSFVDSLVLLVSALDFPVSVSLLNSISVFSGHLFWVAVGSLVLHKAVFPLFGGENPWYKLDLRGTWVYRVLSGYFTSCAVYKAVDVLVALVLRRFGCEVDESETDKSLNNICSSNEPLSILLAALAPCLSAPWWEEVLYRVFAFKLFNSFLPSLPSSLLSASLFSINHLNPRSFFQLFALGLTWSAIHNAADNLLVTFLIHALWNSRIFIGSITGL